MKTPVAGKAILFAALIVCVALGVSLAGCAAGTSEGTISGTVTNSLSGGPVAGATIALDPAIEGIEIETDGSGSYSADLPVGVYSITIEKENYDPATATVSVVAGETASAEVALDPTGPIAIDVGGGLEASPGGTVTLKATAVPLDGSTVKGYEWTQTAGVAATIQNASSDTATATLADAASYRGHLVEDLHPLDRFEVLGINPHSLEEAEAATFKVTVTTSSGSYGETVTVTAHLPYAISLGIRNVPVDVPVLLHGKDQDAYVWTLTAPSASNAVLDDPSIQNPSFAPDVAGKYTLAETNSGATLDVYAGTWTGVIAGRDAEGDPAAESSCLVCHNGSIADDQFSPWAASGHAEILAQNLNTSTHYGEGCFACHSVGFDKGADNGGFDEAADYGDFLDAGLINDPSPDNWATMLAEYPDTARMANIQCENCHGPQDSEAHTQGAVRTSISSEVCGACHGEPLRHGRFQQWDDIARHADYTLAIERADSNHCGRCHVGQGFLAWLPQLEAGNPGNIEAEITWTAETVHPVTCVVCHDAHDQGKTSGEPNTATVRVEGDTPMLPAGFKAVGVGRGAICIVCHNTRNGTHNDSVTATMDDRAPHVAAQGDVLMGQNAYFVPVGERSPHSYIEDSCANCHMELTDPPAAFSYNLAGTNHSFEAGLEICAECHGVFDGGSLQEATEAQLHELKEALESAILDEIKAQTAAGNTVVLKGFGPGETDVEITGGSAVTSVELIETHGRIGMDITVDGTAYEHVRIAADTAVNDGTLLSSAAGQTIAKAGWNYFLIHGDGSDGVHNPDFTMAVLNASLEALE